MKNILSPLYTRSAEAYYKEIQTSSATIDFGLAHSSESLNSIIQISNFITGNLSIDKNSHAAYLDFFGQPATSSAIDLDKSQQKRVRKLIPLLLEEYKIININFISFNPYLNPLEEIFMQHGLRPAFKFLSSVELQADLSLFKSSLRKSYKSLVNWGKNNLDIRVLDSENMDEESFYAFKDLHMKASGRKTRSNISWDKQLASIKCGEAFALFGYLEGKLETGGFFFVDKENCYYGSAASNRNLFNKGLMHSIIFSAVEYCMDKNIKNLVLGDKIFYEDVDPKIKSISDFKSGFSNLTYQCRIFEGQLNN